MREQVSVWWCKYWIIIVWFNSICWQSKWFTLRSYYCFGKFLYATITSIQRLTLLNCNCKLINQPGCYLKCIRECHRKCMAEGYICFHNEKFQILFSATSIYCSSVLEFGCADSSVGRCEKQNADTIVSSICIIMTKHKSPLSSTCYIFLSSTWPKEGSIGVWTLEKKWLKNIHLETTWTWKPTA